EGFLTEAADEGLGPPSAAVGWDVTLVPRQPELRVGHLDDKEIEVGVRGQTGDADPHPLGETQTRDLDRAVGVLEAARRPRGTGPDHVERRPGRLPGSDAERPGRDGRDQREQGEEPLPSTCERKSTILRHDAPPKSLVKIGVRATRGGRQLPVAYGRAA